MGIGSHRTAYFPTPCIHLLDGADGGIAALAIAAATVADGSVTITGMACAGCAMEIFTDGEG